MSCVFVVVVVLCVIFGKIDFSEVKKKEGLAAILKWKTGKQKDKKSFSTKKKPPSECEKNTELVMLPLAYDRYGKWSADCFHMMSRQRSYWCLK